MEITLKKVIYVYDITYNKVNYVVKRTDNECNGLNEYAYEIYKFIDNKRILIDNSKLRKEVINQFEMES